MGHYEFRTDQGLGIFSFANGPVKSVTAVAQTDDGAIWEFGRETRSKALYCQWGRYKQL